MRVLPKQANRPVKRFLEGGPVDAPMEEAPMEEAGAAPQGGGEQDPMMMLAQMSAQALQNQDCLMAMQVCQAFMQLIQQMQGGGAPEEPMYRKGGVLIRKNRRG